MLVAVVHSIPAGHGAKVPFSMMMLLEHVKKGKDLSPDMHCRMVSVSLCQQGSGCSKRPLCCAYLKLK